LRRTCFAIVSLFAATALSLAGVPASSAASDHPASYNFLSSMRNTVVQDKCAQDHTEHFEIAADPAAAGTS